MSLGTIRGPKQRPFGRSSPPSVLFVLTALIHSFWAIPGTLGGIVALVAMVLAFILLTMLAATDQGTLSGADNSAAS